MTIYCKNFSQIGAIGTELWPAPNDVFEISNASPAPHMGAFEKLNMGKYILRQGLSDPHTILPDFECAVYSRFIAKRMSETVTNSSEFVFMPLIIIFQFSTYR